MTNPQSSLRSDSKPAPYVFPQVKIRGGFSNLERVPSDIQIDHVIQVCGSWRPKLGIFSIPPGYIGSMKVVRYDPDFSFLLKYDRAVCGPAWDTETYPTIDNLKTAILKRLACYGIEVNAQMRTDIVDTLISESEAFNSVIEMMDQNMVEQEQSIREAIVDSKEAGGIHGWAYMPPSLYRMFNHIHIAESPAPLSPNREMFMRAMDLFFTKACFHMRLADTKQPYPMECVPVFVGKQEGRKTRFCKWLSMEPEKYYGNVGSKNLEFGSPDFIRQIVGRVVIELGEMNVYAKADVERVKAVISESFDSYTPKYKEGAPKFPRYASFIGTGNNSTFLKDTTGNRRFYPLEIVEIDEVLIQTPEIIKQVWAWYWMRSKYLMELLPESWWDYGNESDDLRRYFDPIRRQAVDIGIAGEFARDAILEIEQEKHNVLLNEQSKCFFVNITPGEVTRKVFGDRAAHAPAEFQKKIAVVFGDMGYARGSVWDGRRNTYGYKCLRTKVVERMGEKKIEE